MPGSSPKAAGAPPQSRRRQSTGIFPSATFDLLERTTPPASSAAATASSTSSSRPPPSASASFGSTLKPPSSDIQTNTNRHSFGMWGGSKAAASTPNLASSSTLHPTDATLSTASSSNSVHGGHMSHLGSGGGSREKDEAEGDGVSMGISVASSSVSTSSSFQQRRKRSESIGNIKNTAGSFGRMVRKSSSNFLKKLAKTFDDKDAPPTPAVPPLPPQATAITPPPPTARTVTMPDISLLIGAGSQNANQSPTSETPVHPLATSPNDEAATAAESVAPSSPSEGKPPLTIRPISFGQDPDRALPSPSTVDRELSASVANVENWLRSTSELADGEELDEPIEPKTPTTPRKLDPESLVATQVTDATTDTKADDAVSDEDQQQGDEEDEDEGDDEDDVDDDIPLAAISMSANRLSKLYESGSLRMNQSQTSLYYSVKSNMDGIEDLDMKRSSYTTFHSYRNSQYSVMTNRESASGAGSANNSSANLDVFDKPLPRRPISMFVPQTTASALSADDDEKERDVQVQILEVQLSNDDEDQDHHEDDGEPAGADILDVKVATLADKSDATSTATGRTSLMPSSSSLLGHDLSWRASSGGRPMTICFDSSGAATANVEAAIQQQVGGGAQQPALPAELSPEAQREAMHDLAKRNSKRCYEEDDTFLHKDEISGYLGSAKQLNKLVLVYYMDYFNFAGLRLDAAFRTLCNKLVLRGETQEVDRILEAFAHRYVTCNPRSIFGSKDIVHAITYSILLLNTDLHVVQQSSKMSRSAFVKNTLQVVQAQIQAQSEGSSDVDPRSSEGHDDSGSSLGVLPPTSGGNRRRPPSVKSWKSGHSQQSTTRMGPDPKANGGHGNGKAWLNELESYLKDIYSSVKHNQILLPITPSTPTSIHSSSTLPNQNTPPGKSNNSPIGGLLARSRLLPSSSNNTSNGSIDLSMGVGSHSYNGSNGGGSGPGRRNSVTSKQKQQLRMEALQRLADQQSNNPSAGAPQIPYHLLPEPLGLSSSSPRLSILGFGDPNLIAATAGSFELKKTAQQTGGGSGEQRDTSILDRRLGPGSNVQLNRLSTLAPSSIISTSAGQSAGSTTTAATLPPKSPAVSTYSKLSATTPKLQLDANFNLYSTPDADTPLPTPGIPPIPASGPRMKREPGYRMEGIMYRKHLLERADKKAQNRAWKKLLVVLDNGGLSMFRADAPVSYPVLIDDAGGNQGALFDEIRLQHTITNMLPPPGYSASRRHVFAIQLFTGAVYLFQVSSPEECEDWVQTCNYWAAKTSKEPLAGGVINMDYGWGRSLDLMMASEAATTTFAGSSSPGGFTALQLSGISVGTDSGTASANTSSTHLGLSAVGSSAANTPATMSPISISRDNDDTQSLHGSIHRSADDNKSLKSTNGSIHGMSASSSTPVPPIPIDSGNSTSTGFYKRGAGISSGPTSSSSNRSVHKEVGTISPPNSGGGSGALSASMTMLGDRAVLFDWTAPNPSLAMSQLDEEAQLDALKRFLASLESEMEVHQEHRGPMMRLFHPKSNNFTKAFNNWEKRSRYLLKEMVKYQVYIECLERSLEIAESQRQLAAAAVAAQGELFAESVSNDATDHDGPNVILEEEISTSS